jgi:2-methylcitrate dehydratase PrpD
MALSIAMIWTISGRDREETIRMTSTGSERSLTERFASECAALTARGLPEAVRQRTRLIVLDTLGAMLSASRPVFPGPRRLAQFLAADGPAGDCTIVGTTLRASATDAALMNGYLGYALDIESHHGAAVMHAAAGVLPAALAEAQQSGASGERLLTAVALGIEVACRVSLAIGPNDLYNRGFHPTSIAGSFGAAAAVAALRGLDGPSFARAFGLASTMTGGLLAWASDESEESRPFNPGTAARNGLTAGRLAALGFGAPAGIFDDTMKYNVFRAWSDDGHGRPAELLRDFGERFAVDELIIKRHACCAFLHPGVDALLDILEETDLAPDAIETITIHFPRTGAPIINANPLRSHRAQYILPVATVRRQVDFADVITDRSAEPAIAALSDRVIFVEDDELDPLYPERYTTVLRIATHDGSTYERRVDFARGTPENQMSDDEIIAKFKQLAAGRVGNERAERIASLVGELDRQARLGPLFDLLTVE